MLGTKYIRLDNTSIDDNRYKILIVYKILRNLINCTNRKIIRKFCN